jgi:dihydrolipoamide dehydrogenase
VQKSDLLVIGSGPGGYRAAVLGALRGLKVTIVEKGTWGGCCLNRGCVPKKAWYHSARLIAAQRGFAARGITGSLAADLAQAWRHQREVVTQVRASYVDYLKRLGVRLIEGAARFSDARTVNVAGESIACGSVIIATGSEPVIPSNVPRCSGRILTTDDLFNTEPPAGDRVAVIGSGVIGTEFAFILSMLGKRVVWLMREAPLSRSSYSVPARKALAAALAEVNVAPRTGSRVVAASADKQGVLLRLPDGGTEEVDWVLLGAGRAPHTEGLDLAAAGVETTATGFIKVDAFQRSSAPSIHAIGDVANAAMTSNHALADAAVAVDNIISPESRRRDDAMVPQVVYSALELARIGLNEEAAEARGLEPAVGFTAFDSNPAALSEGDARGFARVVAEMDTGHLLGAEIAGRDAGELIQILGLEFGAPDALRRLAAPAYNHPARAEEILNAVETLAARWGLRRAILDPYASKRATKPRE